MDDKVLHSSISHFIEALSNFSILIQRYKVQVITSSPPIYNVYESAKATYKYLAIAKTSYFSDESTFSKKGNLYICVVANGITFQLL